jgi:hypothetical protein
MIDVGDYTIGLNGPGMVDHAGVHLATGSATVSAGLVATKTMTYDYAGTVTASIETYQPGKTTPTNNNIGSLASRVSAVNGDDLTILRNEPLAGPASSPVAGFTVNSLFPFSAPYSFFTGTCRYSNPTTDSANSGYFGTYPGAVAVTPSGTPPSSSGSRRSISDGQGTQQQQRAAGRDARGRDSGEADRRRVRRAVDRFKTFTVNGTAGVVGRSKPNSNYVEAGIPFGYYKICFERPPRSAGPRSGPTTTPATPTPSRTAASSPTTTPTRSEDWRVSIDASNTAKGDNSSCQVTS